MMFTFAAHGPHRENGFRCECCHSSWPCQTVQRTTYFDNLLEILDRGLISVVHASVDRRNMEMQKFGDDIIEFQGVWMEHGFEIPKSLRR